MVRNIETSITVDELRKLFEQAGDVRSVHLPHGTAEDRSRGFAFITMSTQNEADRAVSMFNRFLLKGLDMHVTLTMPRKQRGFDPAAEPADRK